MIKPNRSGYLQVSNLHRIYWEEWGNCKGVPVIYLHGGPGGSISSNSVRFFNLHKYRVILFDQRGCGKSVPKLLLEENTTNNLVEDIEKLKLFFRIDKWLIFGGSWGTTLGLCYAIKYPNSVSGLILRGIFLGRPKDWDWFIQPTGVGQLFPEKYAKFIEIVPDINRNDILSWYYSELLCKDPQRYLLAGSRWSNWENSLLFFNKKINFPTNVNIDYQIALMECHYAINRTFLNDSNYILNNIKLLMNIPIWLIHGQYDFICSPTNAYELHLKLPKSNLHIIKNASHSSSEPGIFKFLCKATKEFLKLIKQYQKN